MSNELGLLRSQIARIVGNDPRAIRAFEALFSQTNTVIPSNVQDVEIAAANAEAMAAQAVGAIDRLADMVSLLALAPPAIPTEAAASTDAWSSTTVDFGSTPVSDAEFTIVDASCDTSSILEFAISGASSTSTNDANSHAMASVLFSFAAIPASGQFVLQVGTLYGMVTGEFIIKYKVGV